MYTELLIDTLSNKTKYLQSVCVLMFVMYSQIAKSSKQRFYIFILEGSMGESNQGSKTDIYIFVATKFWKGCFCTKLFDYNNMNSIFLVKKNTPLTTTVDLIDRTRARKRFSILNCSGYGCADFCKTPSLLVGIHINTVRALKILN